jgi:transcriptional regulator NrdR family protein
MKCPECGAETAVIDSRPALGTVRRRRECTACGHRFTTREVNQEDWENLREAARRAAVHRRIANAVRTLLGELSALEASE